MFSFTAICVLKHHHYNSHWAWNFILVWQRFFPYGNAASPPAPFFGAAKLHISTRLLGLGWISMFRRGERLLLLRRNRRYAAHGHVGLIVTLIPANSCTFDDQQRRRSFGRECWGAFFYQHNLELGVRFKQSTHKRGVCFKHFSFIRDSQREVEVTLEWWEGNPYSLRYALKPVQTTFAS